MYFPKKQFIKFRFPHSYEFECFTPFLAINYNRYLFFQKILETWEYFYEGTSTPAIIPGIQVSHLVYSNSGNIYTKNV
jgi:hypothetical protein